MVDEPITPSRQYCPSNDLEELSAWLVGHMPKLHTLSLFVSYVPTLPALRQLAHLELQAIRFEGINDSLRRMHSLQTAVLACKHMEAQVRVLDLSGLLRLKQLSLHDVYPDVLKIPESCRLDLHGEAHTMQQVLCALSSLEDIAGRPVP